MEYFNNKVICDLVEASRTGIIAILDEACLNVGKISDKVPSLQIYAGSSYQENPHKDTNVHLFRNGGKKLEFQDYKLICKALITEFYDVSCLHQH